MFWAEHEVGWDKLVAGLEKHGFTVAQSLKAKAGAKAPEAVA